MINGQASFSEIAFVGPPGSTKKFFVRTGLINPANLKVWLGGEQKYLEIEAWFTVQFWLCIEGEELVNNMCAPCSDGQYSLVLGDLCKPCMDNVICEGANRLNLTKGYWRDSLNRSDILKCYEESACEGGFYPNLTNPV